MPDAKSPNDKLAPSTPTAKSRLQQLILAVERPAKAKGWKVKVISEDEEAFKYATVTVSRLTTGNFFDEVTATFDITCDQKAKISSQRTSVFDYGLEDLIEAVQTEFHKLYPAAPSKPQTKETPPFPSVNRVSGLVSLLRRFHAVVRQLKHRHADRQTLAITDEYDVQDLLHGILRGLFDDVRAEEYSPSYAGGSSRMDFLLKSYKTVLEVKMANVNLRDKQVGEQLIVDIKRYQQHPDAKSLICFVYDPGGFIKNPGGLESDLGGIHEKLEVKVIVVSV